MLRSRSGGSAQQSKTGHAFIKETMRRVDAVYGGEMSAHHYFRDFAYCDSGMIPWLLVAEIMSTTGKTLASLVEERTKAFPVFGRNQPHGFRCAGADSPGRGFVFAGS
jgi:phosphomannomutase